VETVKAGVILARAEPSQCVDLAFEALETWLVLLRQHGARHCLVDTALGRAEVAKELFRLAYFVVFSQVCFKLSLDMTSSDRVSLAAVEGVQSVAIAIVNSRSRKVYRD
jgi:hypothetical protein